MARSLSVNERSALDALLACDFVGAPALRAQAASVQAEGDGLIIDLVVDHSLPLATVASRVPVEAPVTDDEGHDGGLLLFVADGRLSALEYWWTSDEKPTGFPDAHSIGEPEPRT